LLRAGKVRGSEEQHERSSHPALLLSITAGVEKSPHITQSGEDVHHDSGDPQTRSEHRNALPL